LPVWYYIFNIFTHIPISEGLLHPQLDKVPCSCDMTLYLFTS
jgi:hypothetical protein